MQVSTIDGDTDDDGDYDQLFSYGGRSFTIRDTSGNIVFNSGNQLDAIALENVSDPADLDGRSDNKDSEPGGDCLKFADQIRACAIAPSNSRARIGFVK